MTNEFIVELSGKRYTIQIKYNDGMAFADAVKGVIKNTPRKEFLAKNVDASRDLSYNNA